MIRKTIITLALLVLLAAPSAADVIQVVGGSNSGVKVIINHTKNTSTMVFGDTDEVDTVIVVNEGDDE